MPYETRAFTRRVRGLVLKRAVDLIRQNKVERIDLDENHAQYHVENQKGGFYIVEIRFQAGRIGFTHCDCSYRGVGLCKHTAASLLHLLHEEGFDPKDLSAEDFVFEDSDVLDEQSDEEMLKELLNEIAHDRNFSVVNFLSSQDKQSLLTFILRYLEESEDLRLVVMAYLWYKNEEESERRTYLS